MSLCTKLLAFFGLLAVVPLLGMGIFHYVQAMRTLEAHVAAQVELIAERAAGELAHRQEVKVSDMLLLAENAETQRLFRARSAGEERPEHLTAARDYARQAWEQFSVWYDAIELRDTADAVLIRLGESAAAPREPEAWGGFPATAAALEQPILDEESGVRLGTVAAWPRLAEALPREVLEARFGSAGYTVVLDRPTGGVLHHPRRTFSPQAPLPAAELEFDPGAATAAQPRGTFTYHESDSVRVAAFVHLEDPPWTVVATSALDEFAAPFERMRNLTLVVVLLVILGIALASTLLVRNATRSLEELTAAADRVGRGDFSPRLPPPGSDEVGRLSADFALMVERVRSMMAQLEASRQMAAVGEFASELAHEIRNPLTSVKLNLQRIERGVRANGNGTEAAEPLRIALREIQRLERVVRGVLHLARPRPLQRAWVGLHAVVAEALEVVRPLAERQGVRVSLDLAAPQDEVAGEAEQLRGALLNLLLNAVEAMPQGGELRVASALRDAAGCGGDQIEVTVADSGPGIPPEAREQLFRPFFTTKPEGTGLGLALALRTAEEHGGRLELAEPGAEDGAVFRFLLPLAAARVPA